MSDWSSDVYSSDLRPFAPGHVPVEPGVRGVEHRARIGDAARVAVGLGAQAVEDDFLLRRGNVVVEVPVHAAYLERGARVGGQQGHRPGMVQAQILDDDAGLDDGTAGEIGREACRERVCQYV